ncbi:MAG TPA: hypothetical protein VGT02_13230 [Methylomirabilota bacterium]|jgi:hypothetical protein|nr:hypothetical protein [Methylomirabilota bacterium]
MELFLPDADRTLLSKSIEHVMAADEETARLTARISAFLDSGDAASGGSWANVLYRFTVVRARMQTARDQLGELLDRATALAQRGVNP